MKKPPAIRKARIGWFFQTEIFNPTIDLFIPSGWHQGYGWRPTRTWAIRAAKRYTERSWRKYERINSWESVK